MKDFDTRNFVISFDKFAKLGYQTRFTLEDGIREMVKLYRFYKPFSAYATI
jgi:nucleoside-diphosphate-sugar epimerase